MLAMHVADSGSREELLSVICSTFFSGGTLAHECDRQEGADKHTLAPAHTRDLNAD